MMKKIWKYRLDLSLPRTSMVLPADARGVHVHDG